jgi:iron complex outermembrane recepter protein
MFSNLKFTKCKTMFCQLVLIVCFSVSQTTLPHTTKTIHTLANTIADTTTTLNEITVTAPRIAQPKSGVAKSGYRVDSVSTGPLGIVKLQDLPYSISAISKELIESQQSQYISDAIRFIPSITHASGTNTVGGGASFTVRGFSGSTNEAVDGLIANSRVPVEDKERIDIMNGPSSFMNGIASPVGTINYILKHSLDTLHVKLTLGNYGGEQAYIHGDIGGPILKNKLGYRINLMYVNNGDVGIKDQTHERYLTTGVFDWNISKSTACSFDISRYYVDVEHGDDNFSIGNKVNRIPSAPDASSNYMPPYSSAIDWVNRYGFELKSKLSSFFTLRSSFRYSDVDRFRHRAAITITNNSGDFTMSRNFYNTEWFAFQGNTFLDATFSTGIVNHTIITGAGCDFIIYKYASPYVSPGKVTFPGVNNIYNLKPWPNDSSEVTIGDPDETTEKTRTAFGLVADNIHIGNSWSAIIGSAYADILDRNWDYSNYVSTGIYKKKPEYNKGALTPTFSLAYKPISSVTTYVTYIEALQKGIIAPSTAANANEALDPYSSSQIEIGVKSSLIGIDLNSALYWITSANAFTDPVSNIYSEDGREVHYGGEVSVNGKIGHFITISGGFTILRAEQTKTSTPTTQNKVPAGVPEKAAKLFGEFAIPFLPSLVINGGLSYTGKQWVNATNTLSIPSIIVGDAGIRYGINIQKHSMVLRAKVTNITDKNYWQTGGSSLTLGSPRTYAFSLSFQM